jgi:hypothetical protein
MAYVVYTSNGNFLTSIPTGIVNSSTTSLSLIGRDVIGYGQYYNQNLISMLTNFSNSTAPSNPIQGQLWYDNYYNKLKVYNNAWQTLRAAPIATTQPVGQDPGELWYDSNTGTKALNFVDNQGQYNTITSFPRNSIGGWQYPKNPVTDNSVPNPLPQKVTLLQNYGQTIGALTTSSFTVSTQQSTSTFTAANTSSVQLAAGLTIIGNIRATNGLLVNQYTPAHNTSTGVVGQLAFDSRYFYVCTGTNNWSRISLPTTIF